MPSVQRRRYLLIALILLVPSVVGLGIFLNRSSEQTVLLEDGSTLSVVDFTTGPNEKLFLGAAWKKPALGILENTRFQTRLNAGRLVMTNMSAISWYRNGPTNSPLPSMILNNQVVAIDSQGKEHPAQFFLSGYVKEFNGGLGEMMVCIFPVPLGAAPTVRIYQMNITNEFRLKK